MSAVLEKKDEQQLPLLSLKQQIAAQEAAQIKYLSTFKLGVMPRLQCAFTSLIQDQAPIPGFDRYLFTFNDGDTLSIVVQHATEHSQLILSTRDPDLASALPNTLSGYQGFEFSLLGELEKRLQVYETRVEGYQRQARRRAKSDAHRVTAEVKGNPNDKDFGLSKVERKKRKIITDLLKTLKALKVEELKISQINQVQQDEFRNKVFELIEEAITANRIASNHFATGDGYLNNILYDAKIFCAHFVFNRHKRLTPADQNIFSQKIKKENRSEEFLVWDSDKNSDASDDAIQAALFIISKKKNLALDFKEDDPHFSPLPFEESSRIGRIDQAIEKIKQSTRDIADYFTVERPLFPEVKATRRSSIAGCYLHSGSILPTPRAKKNEEDREEKIGVNPSERDLFIMANLAKENLYWWRRVVIQLKILADSIPIAIRYAFESAKRWLRSVWKNFNSDINKGHPEAPKKNISKSEKIEELKKAFSRLENHLKKETFLLQEDESLEQFIQRKKSEHYHSIKPDTPKIEIRYNNPISIALSIVKAFGNLFRHHSEKNPIMGSIGIIAYAYGVSAIAMPAVLTDLLSKMHLGFLTAGIEPSQSIAGVLASGLNGKAIAAGFTYWKIIALVFDIDSISIESIKQLQEDPVSLAFILGIAIGLGYVTSEMVPAFEEELGTFRVYGWFLLGLKVGAGLADAVYHPSSNIISRVLGWAFSIPVLAMRTFLDPIVEILCFEEDNWILNKAYASWEDVDWLLREIVKKNPSAKFSPAFIGILGAVFVFAIAIFGFFLPQWLTHFTSTQQGLPSNTFFQFGRNFFRKEGYDFLPRFFSYDCYADYFLLHPARLLGLLFTLVVNFLFLLFYISAPILKITAFVASFILPTYFTSEPFKKSMHRLLVKLAEGLDAVFNIFLTLLRMLFDELPGFLHIIYRGMSKLIAKTFGTLGDPGMIADLLLRFSKRKYNPHFSAYDEQNNRLGLRFNPNYGFTHKIWIYIDLPRSWPLVLHLLFAVILIPFALVIDGIKNLLLLLTDIICLGLRLLTWVADWLSRSVALILGAALKIVDVIINPDGYLVHIRKFMGWESINEKNEEDLPVFTLGYLLRELGRQTIYLTDAIDGFFGAIKRSFLSAINRAEIESQGLLCPLPNCEDKGALSSDFRVEEEFVNLLTKGKAGDNLEACYDQLGLN